MAKVTPVIGVGEEVKPLKASAMSYYIDFSNWINDKLSNLYDVATLRWYKDNYGEEEMKELVLDKLKRIEEFDDCEIITDFTAWNEDGVGVKLVGTDDSYSVTKTEDELTITITTDGTTGGRSVWVYKNFPSTVSKVFISCIVNIGAKYTTIEVVDDDPSTYFNPPNLYMAQFNPAKTNEDFFLVKNINGTGTVLATEAVDLTAETDYKLAYYVDLDNDMLKAWREVDPVDLNSPTLSASDSDITQLVAYRFRYDTNSTGVTQSAIFKVPVIIAWKV